MTTSSLSASTIAALLAGCLLTWTPALQAGQAPDPHIRHIVDATIVPLQHKDRIPGLAIGILAGGRTQVYNYGFASLKPRRAVTDDTLFELGSVSKTFTATLAAWSQTAHRLSLADHVSRYLPALRNRPFGKATLLQLGTHTMDGLALQLPGHVHNDRQLLTYLGTWRPQHTTGLYRSYSNIGIGVLGLIVARAWKQDFSVLMQTRLLPALGMDHSYLEIPARRKPDYAQGYTHNDQPIRMAWAELAAPAYGIRSTATDMVRFLQLQMDGHSLPARLRDAIALTHMPRFRAGPLVQDLIWEQYPYPVTRQRLLAGNGRAMIFGSTPATPVAPPTRATDRVWINKTGSTNGFSAYVAFIPCKRLGIVILANRNIPIRDRVTAAYRILTALDTPTP